MVGFCLFFFCFTLSNKIKGLLENTSYIFRCERSRKTTPDDLRIAKEGIKQMNKKDSNLNGD